MRNLIAIVVILLAVSSIWLWSSLTCFLNNCDQELINDCVKNQEVKTSSCTAYDKNSLIEFNVSPSASCKLSLIATDGYFFLEDKVQVVAESYRNISGKKAQQAVVPFFLAESDNLIIKFEGSIGCTNDKGFGESCKSSASIKASSYPNKCFKVKDKLLELEQL